MKLYTLFKTEDPENDTLTGGMSQGDIWGEGGGGGGGVVPTLRLEMRLLRNNTADTGHR